MKKTTAPLRFKLETVMLTFTFLCIVFIQVAGRMQAHYERRFFGGVNFVFLFAAHYSYKKYGRRSLWWVVFLYAIATATVLLLTEP